MAHFDDDDLYSANYLDVMYRELVSGVSKRYGPNEVEKLKRGVFPSIATLSEWHMMDIADFTFRYMDPKVEPMRPDWRSAMIYGYGFSYIFSRGAWDLVAFPDREGCEDDIFMAGLRRKATLVTLVTLALNEITAGDGLVAHAFHSDCSSGGEWNGQKRLGRIVKTPRAFEHILPVVHEVAKKLPRGGAAGPPPTMVEQRAPPPASSQWRWWTRKPNGVKGKGKGAILPPPFQRNFAKPSGVRTQTRRVGVM